MLREVQLSDSEIFEILNQIAMKIIFENRIRHTIE